MKGLRAQRLRETEKKKRKRVRKSKVKKESGKKKRQQSRWLISPENFIWLWRMAHKKTSLFFFFDSMKKRSLSLSIYICQSLVFASTLDTDELIYQRVEEKLLSKSRNSEREKWSSTTKRRARALVLPLPLLKKKTKKPTQTKKKKKSKVLDKGYFFFSLFPVFGGYRVKSQRNMLAYECVYMCVANHTSYFFFFCCDSERDKLSTTRGKNKWYVREGKRDVRRGLRCCDGVEAK